GPKTTAYAERQASREPTLAGKRVGYHRDEPDSPAIIRPEGGRLSALCRPGPGDRADPVGRDRQRTKRNRQRSDHQAAWRSRPSTDPVEGSRFAGGTARRCSQPSEDVGTFRPTAYRR